MRQITKTEEYQNLKNKEEIFFIYKHSTACPVSFKAADEVDEFLNQNKEMVEKFNKIHVIEDREVSNFVAEDLGVRHHSPQLLLVKNNQCIWNDSHARLTSSKIAEIVAENF